jgi:hypothetical protein
LSQIIAEFLPFVMATIILWVLSGLWIRRTLRNPGNAQSGFPAHFPIFVILWFACSTGVTFIGSRMFGHYFIQILPALCLMAAMYAGYYLHENNVTHWKGWKYVTLILTILPGIVFTGMAISFEATTDTWGEIKPDFRPAAAYIKKHTTPQDKIFVWGWFTPIYVYSERTPSTRFVNTHMHTGYKKGEDPNEKDRADIAWQAIPEAWPMLEKDLAPNPPELIVDTSPGNYHDFGRYPIKDFPILRKFLDEHCRLETTIAGNDIYRCR